MRRSIISILFAGTVLSMTAQPVAYLTKGLTEVCSGDSTQAYLAVTGGDGPWTVEISSTLGVYRTLEDIPSNYTFWLVPTNSTTYFISAVFDSNGVEGTGNGSVPMTVRPRMPVRILLDQTIYLASDAPVSLMSDPPGATFFGQGVLGSTFYPAFADPENSPFDISCIYYNQYGCPTYDTVVVNVIWGVSDVVLVSGGDTINTVCRDDTNYEIRGSNRDSIPGLFSLREAGTGNPVTGHILDDDSTDNLAMFDPAGLIGTYELVYEYSFDILTIPAIQVLNINDLENLTIEGVPDQVCQSDDPYLLTPANVAGDPEAVYTFSGPGISGNQASGYYFDPASDDVPLGQGTIVMEYASSNGCAAKVTRSIQTLFAPEVSFTYSPSCLSAGGSTVSFNNTTSGKFAVEEWTWNFGDPESGDQNRSSAENPTHFYSEPGARNITLTAITDQGCTDSTVQEVVLSDQPQASLDWVNDCYVRGGETSFMNLSVSNVSEIASLLWTFKNENGSVLGTVSSEDPAETIGFSFASKDDYQVQLEVWDLEGCYDKVTETISLKPTLALDLQGYTEDFNGHANGWSAGSTGRGPSSWLLDVPDFKGFEPASAEDYAWYTQLPESPEDSVEYSAVESPCFDFSQTQNPSLSLDLMKSFIPGEDGAVLQYMSGDDQEWRTLGSIGAGDHWYNVSGLVNRPGGSDAGWGNAEGTTPDSTWQRARLPVDELNGMSLLKFRVALASSMGTAGNEGFAFDNFMISEDFRGSILEHFTNASQEASSAADDQVDAFALGNTAKVIDIQYHLDYPGADPMNANNPEPPLNRQFQKGVPAPPFAILNGRADEAYRFDFSGPGESPDQELLDQASLESAPFSIDLQVDWLDQSLEAEVRVTCVAGTFDPNVQLYVVVMETLVTAYTGLNGDNEFRNVVLDMLPTQGTLLGSQWISGKEVTNTFSWEYPSYVEDVEDLAVVAFVTDRDHGGAVLQAEATYLTPQVGSGPAAAGIRELALFPNPTRGMIYVRLGETAAEGSMLEICDVSGKQVMAVDIPAGYRTVQLDAGSFPAGLYILSWKTAGSLRGRAKLIRSR